MLRIEERRERELEQPVVVELERTMSLRKSNWIAWMLGFLASEDLGCREHLRIVLFELREVAVPVGKE